MHHIGNSKNVRQWPEQHWQSVVGHISVYILLQADPQFLLESNSVVRELFLGEKLQQPLGNAVHIKLQIAVLVLYHCHTHRRRVTKTNANQKTKVYLHIKHSVRHWNVGS